MITIPTPDFAVLIDAAVVAFGMIVTVNLLQNARNLLTDSRDFFKRVNDPTQYRNRSRGDMYNKFHK